eukprot:scaffold27353_cov130-Amphora_coffeaeformis.AAC.1
MSAEFLLLDQIKTDRDGWRAQSSLQNALEHGEDGQDGDTASSVYSLPKSLMPSFPKMQLNMEKMAKMAMTTK